MTESIPWDGRASFYPAIGYDIDKEHIKMYEDVMEREGFCEEDSEASKDSESDDSNATDGDAIGVTDETFTSPPLYDRDHHYHPFHNKDWSFSISLRMNGRFQAQELAHSLVSRYSKKEVPTGPRSIPMEVLNLIHQNRTNVPKVKKALTSTFVLDLQIAGLKEVPPNRRVRVLGNISLAEFHDRFLCSAFGWTRGYHTYAYVVPPSGYERQPPRSPHADISFGTIGKMSIFSANHGFFGTLRNRDLFVDEESVLLADLLQSPGHQLHHVLATSGWKTLITVEDVTTAGNLKPDILSGSETNVPENIIMEFDHCSDTGGTQAYAYALELLRRADLDHNRNEWMRDEALRALRVKDQDLFDPRKPFDLRAARRALYNALCDDPRPNPEHFNLQAMMMMMGMGLPGRVPFGSDTTNTEQDACSQCHKTTHQIGSKTLKKCKRCQQIKYCCKECQKQDWKEHKKVCGKKI